MYMPAAFAQTDVGMLQDTMRAHPLAAIVTVTASGLVANHIPLLIDDAPAPYGTLRGHIARANPMWQSASTETEALAIFQGPSAYVSPSWYPTTHETGKAVPTWNYVVVHAYGIIRFAQDAAWLRTNVAALTERNETGRPSPWSVDDAPADFLESLLHNIVGVEIPITRLLGKWKLSQNRARRDVDAVIQALDVEPSLSSRAVADAMRRCRE